MIEILEDDLSGEATRRLIALHLSAMRDNSPPENAFALDLTGLQAPNVTVWSAWEAGAIAGIAALKIHDGGIAELKSMRTHPAHLRKGVALALLDHIVEEARARGLRRLSLETGSGPAFDAALALYRRRGFRSGEAFAGYAPSAFNQFLHLDL